MKPPNPFADPEADTSPQRSVPPAGPEPDPAQPDPHLPPLPDRKVPADASAVIITDDGENIKLKLVLPAGTDPDDDNVPLSASVAIDAMQHIVDIGKEGE